MLIHDRGCAPNDILVLSPRRLIANEIKRRLREMAIAAHSFYNDKLLEPGEVQVAMTKLQLLANREDRVALRYWLGEGSSSWRRNQYSHLRRHCEQTGQSPMQALTKSIAGDIHIPGISKLIERCAELQTEFERLAPLTIEGLFDDLFPGGQEWADPIRELVTGKISEIENPADLLDLLRTEITQPEMPPEGNFVRSMSLHKSKGLTSRVTIIIGCIHGLIPFVSRQMLPAELSAHPG
jgi:DNA helicase-2/ATP-dependent DNA helicase PcrA